MHEEVVQRGIDLFINALAVLLSVCNSLVNELRILGLLRRGEDQRGVGGGILRLVLANGRKVTRVADDSLQRRRLVSAGSNADGADVDRRRWWWWWGKRCTYGASGLELVERGSHDGCLCVCCGLKWEWIVVVIGVGDVLFVSKSSLREYGLGT